MRIEEAIQQNKPFRSEHHRAMVNLIFTHNWILERHRELFKPYGITNQQYNVLRILKGSYPTPISTCVIRERMLDKMSDVSRMIDRMELKGWVVKSICENDKRLVDVVVTDAGLDLLSSIDSEENGMDSLLEVLTPEEAATLNELLDKIRG